jgi:hypothetical protein
MTSLALAGAACQSPEPSAETGLVTTNPGESSGDPTGEGDPTGDDDPTGDGDGDTCVSALDILLVVDNSGGMTEEQARLATGVSGLIDPLDAAGVDWRIGVTTTDNGNPWCPPDVTTPEAGKLVLSPCTSRLDDFTWSYEWSSSLDIACLDVCPLDQIEIVPTATQLDPSEQTRPWIEKIDGITNLADNLDPATALGCLLPMGLNGCAFESQLESAYLALRRAQTVDEAEYGFLRTDASLLVIIVTDEVDCSYNDEYADIFTQDGNKAFWTDPAAEFPTSALCWNAGVVCTGDPSGYDSCEPVNKDIDGNLNVADADAVLHPLSRYFGLLDSIESQRQDRDPTARVRVSLISGAALDGSLIYADSPDPEFQDRFGIGPACTNGEDDENSEALPPVRMRDVSNHTAGSIHSSCANEYASALADIVEPFIAACG